MINACRQIADFFDTSILSARASVRVFIAKETNN